MRALAVFGITGRMGQALLAAMQETPNFILSGAIASVNSARVGQDAAAGGPPSGVLITADSRLGLRGATVAVDFSSGTGAPAHAQACAAASVPVLVGATGYDAAGRLVLEQAAKSIPVLIAPNTSVGVALMIELVSLAAARLGSSYDVEIFEAHHRMKRDAPSGTALALGEAVARARAVPLNDVAAFERSALNAPRAPGSIGFSSLRAGDIVGEHTVTFAAAGERMEITHRVTDRMTFARGALRAAEWLVERPAGLYGMRDVLGL
jgi:4-hydroxy-tetrahydrodipicolinate reductase